MPEKYLTGISETSEHLHVPGVYVYVVSLVSWGGVRLSPLGMSATKWPIVPAPDDRWWAWSSRWNENWQGKPKYSEKTCPSATLSTTNNTWPDLDSNPGLRGGKPATNRLNYGTAGMCVCKLWMSMCKYIRMCMYILYVVNECRDVILRCMSMSVGPLTYGREDVCGGVHAYVGCASASVHVNVETRINSCFYVRTYIFVWAGIATSYGLDDRGVGVRVPVGSRIFSSPRRPDRLWGPSSLVSNGYRGLFPWGESGRGVELTSN
jgi:hypothetical protein